MALDIDIVIKRKNRPSDKDLRELQYHLMHRFGMDTFRMIGEDGADGKRFVDVAEGGDGTFGIRLYLRSRYYERGYERGDGLRAAMMLLYLIRAYPDGEVWYGSDGLGEYGEDFLKQYDAQKALQLLYHFLDVGKLPYAREMDEALNSVDGTESPLCTFCGFPMIRKSMSSKFASFYCIGCEEQLKLTGDVHEHWIKTRKKSSSKQTDNNGGGTHHASEHSQNLDQAERESVGISETDESVQKRLAHRRAIDYMEIYLSSQITPGGITDPAEIRIPDAMLKLLRSSST